MEVIVEIIKILANNILQTDEGLPKDLTENIKKFTRNFPVLNECLNAVHMKKHLKYTLDLKACKNPHCLECLNDSLDSGLCNHGSKLTYYEKSQVAALVKDLEDVDNERILLNRCSKCGDVYYKIDMSLKRCPCYQCSKCLFKRYQSFEITCQICGRAFDKDEIRDIADTCNFDNVETFEICQGCGLPIYSKGFDGEKCFICVESAKIKA